MTEKLRRAVGEQQKQRTVKDGELQARNDNLRRLPNGVGETKAIVSKFKETSTVLN